MRKLEIVDSFGDTIVVEPELGLYTAYDFMSNKMPVLGIELYSYDEEGEREPYSTLTVNFGEFIGAKDCMYIDTNNNSFTAQLLGMGFCQDTGFTKQSGFCTYPLWKFDTDFLREIDVHGVYDVYSNKYDKYMSEGPDLPVEDRADKILGDVLSSLGIDDIDLWFTVDDGVVEATRDGNKMVGADFYRYLLAEICEYEENGAVKGLDLDLCHDFYELCEHNGVDYKTYNNPDAQKQTEYVIVMYSGSGISRVSQDYMTCSSFEEAEKICENYGWVCFDENEFAWRLEIDEREVSIEKQVESDNNFYYELHVVEDEEKGYGYSVYFSYDSELDFDSATNLAVENGLLDAEDTNYVDDFNVLSKEEYGKATNYFDPDLDNKLADAIERSEKTDTGVAGRNDIVKE